MCYDYNRRCTGTLNFSSSIKSTSNIPIPASGVTRGGRQNAFDTTDQKCHSSIAIYITVVKVSEDGACWRWAPLVITYQTIVEFDHNTDNRTIKSIWYCFDAFERFVQYQLKAYEDARRWKAKHIRYAKLKVRHFDGLYTSRWFLWAKTRRTTLERYFVFENQINFNCMLYFDSRYIEHKSCGMYQQNKNVRGCRGWRGKKIRYDVSNFDISIHRNVLYNIPTLDYTHRGSGSGQQQCSIRQTRHSVFLAATGICRVALSERQGKGGWGGERSKKKAVRSLVVQWLLLTAVVECFSVLMHTTRCEGSSCVT